MQARDQVGRWQDWSNMFVGLFLFLSPFLKDYPDDLPGAMWNAFGAGIGVIFFSGLAVDVPGQWKENVNVVFGLWLIVAPWLLQFSLRLDVTAISVVVGLVVTTFALSTRRFEGVVS